nr:ribonuclease H-like domain-containing protein [Tanacetum cinerariifolium]
MAFVSSSLNNNTNSSNESVNTAFGVTTTGTQVNAANSTNIDNLSDAIIYAFILSQSNSSQLVNENLEQIHPDDLEEMDLKWQMAMLTMRARIFLKNTGRKLNLNGNETVAFDKIKDVRKNYGPPIIEDLISDSEDEAESRPKIERKLLNLVLLK